MIYSWVIQLVFEKEVNLHVRRVPFLELWRRLLFLSKFIFWLYHFFVPHWINLVVLKSSVFNLKGLKPFLFSHQDKKNLTRVDWIISSFWNRIIPYISWRMHSFDDKSLQTLIEIEIYHSNQYSSTDGS